MARIRVLPGDGGTTLPRTPPDVIFTAGPDFWFDKDGPGIDTGFSVALDWLLHSGPLRITLFLEAGAAVHRTSWREQRLLTRDVGGEIIQFLAEIRVEEERMELAGSCGLALSAEGRFSRWGSLMISVGGGPAVQGRTGGGMARGLIFAGWRKGSHFAGVRLGATGRWTDEFLATVTVGLALGIEFQ